MEKIRDKNQEPLSGEDEKDAFPGYPVYPANEDIYSQFTEEEWTQESGNRSGNPPYGQLNEKDFGEDMSGSDLDVPGSELDDDLEEIGSEDEENNYYSLGGDDHNDLDED